MKKETYLIAGFIIGVLMMYVVSLARPAAGAASAYSTTGVLELKSAAEVQSLIDSGRKVYILYHASWCGHCKTLKPMFESVSDEMDDSVFAQCECASNEDVPQKHGIRAFPCVRKYEGGKQVGEMMGSRADKATVKKALQEM